jgi:zinc transporter ZupT
MEIKLLSMLFMGASTVVGMLIGLLVGNIPHRLNDAMLGLAAGIMLAASILGLIEPAFSEPGGMSLALALSGIADAAGVEKQNIRLFFLVGKRVTGAAQHGAQRFGVALIHLAAVSFDKNLHRSSKIR